MDRKTAVRVCASALYLNTRECRVGKKYTVCLMDKRSTPENGIEYAVFYLLDIKKAKGYRIELKDGVWSDVFPYESPAEKINLKSYTVVYRRRGDKEPYLMVEVEEGDEGSAVRAAHSISGYPDHLPHDVFLSEVMRGKVSQLYRDIPEEDEEEFSFKEGEEYVF